MGNNMGGMNQGMAGNNSMSPQNQMQGGPGPMRPNRISDRQQNRNTPYKNQQNNGNRGGNFQRRNNDNGGQMGNNSNPGMNRFDNNMPNMDNRQTGGMNNFDRGMNSNNMMDRRGGGGFDNDNNFGGFGEDRRGFALPSFPNDMGQNNFGNNDRQNSGMGNRRSNGEIKLLIYKNFKINPDFFLIQDHLNNSVIITTWAPEDRTLKEDHNRTWEGILKWVDLETICLAVVVKRQADKIGRLSITIMVTSVAARISVEVA